MRFRTDGEVIASLKANGENKPDFIDQSEWDRTPKAEIGDVWRIFWYHHVDQQQVDDQIAGYAICCPKCREVHYWTSASNCDRTGGSCVHEKQRTSCWNWTGSAEANQLSATPSLLCHTCGWHGYLTNGELIGQ
jgi:hypothetical protein